MGYISKIKRVVITTVLLFGFGFAGSLWGQQCVQSNPEAKTVAVIDATTGCASIGQQGCRIVNGIGSCTVEDPDTNDIVFTATSNLSNNPDSAIEWSVSGVTPQYGAADSVLMGGASQGNACGYFYTNDEELGSGGFLKSNETFSNVQFVDVCTNLEPDAPPPPPPPAPEAFASCPDYVTSGGLLDETGIVCPIGSAALVCNFELDADAFGTDDEVCCLCNVEESFTCDLADPDNPENPCPVNVTYQPVKSLGIDLDYTPGCGWFRINGRNTYRCW